VKNIHILLDADVKTLHNAFLLHEAVAACAPEDQHRCIQESIVTRHLTPATNLLPQLGAVSFACAVSVQGGLPLAMHPCPSCDHYRWTRENGDRVQPGEGVT
jgi:hypothetical protein